MELVEDFDSFFLELELEETAVPVAGFLLAECDESVLFDADDRVVAAVGFVLGEI